MSGQSLPTADQLHEAARSILDSPAWQMFGAYYRASALADVEIAAQADDEAAVEQACVRIRALRLVEEGIAVILADAKMKAVAAERQRRRTQAEQRGAPQ